MIQIKRIKKKWKRSRFCFNKYLTKRRVGFIFSEKPVILNDSWMINLRDQDGKRSGHVDATGSSTSAC